MALWPPSLLSSNKSSLSAGAFKVSDTHCANEANEDEKLPRTGECRKHFSFLAADKRDILQTLGRSLSKAMRPYRLLASFP
ncbi:MAG: hypothetical protein KI790_16575 [Cyclobacteriaceae bacterium]|nr:hypothetical protein [Cyclobacteriaceae bacterium HetDA_MAG_MS6]